MPIRLRIGTRASPLALAQTQLVAAKLRQAHADLEPAEAIDVVIIKTSGDRILDRPLMEVGGKGLFTKEIEEALLDRHIDMAVHSMKDMATKLPQGLMIGAMLEREDPRDTLISHAAQTIDDLPVGAVVGSASLRRGSQILARRPDLSVVTIRGSVQTRLRKLENGDVDATVLAQAGLNRLGLNSTLMHVLATDVMLPAVAQGAIGVECRTDDNKALDRLAPLVHLETTACVTIERQLLARLDGSCRTPIAGYCQLRGDRFHLDALVAKPDGSVVHRQSASCSRHDADHLGHELGSLLAVHIGPDFFVA